MHSSPTDPTAVANAARQLFAEHGIEALMEAQMRILQANSDGDADKEAFWQEVSRLLQSPGQRFRPLL